MSGTTDEPPLVLLVEDEPAHVELICAAFEGHTCRYTLTVARNLREARAILADRSPDLVIADLRLPDGRGTELLPQEPDEAGCPVLVLTSHGNEQIAVEAMKLGAFDYVVKSEAVLAEMPHIVERTLREWENITERKRAEKILRQREAELAHMARLSTLGEMVAGIAHEMNQPLFAISAFAEACANRLDKHPEQADPDVRQWIEQIGSTTTQASQILSRLRHFVSPPEPERQRVKINDLVHESVELVVFDKRERASTLALELDPQDAEVSVDRVQIQQVLVNLLRNAYDAVQAKPADQRRVTIRSSAGPEWVEVAVIDNGVGLEPETREKLFEAFYSTKPGGMGMGLAVSRSIILAHGGTLTADANPAGGSIFRFDLSRLA